MPLRVKRPSRKCSPMEIEEGRCPACGQWISEEDRSEHERGVDTKRLACPHQDLEEIAAEREPQDLAHRVW